MLTLKNVSAGYDGADVIRDISMEVKSSLCLIGPNASGKTTLLKAMANILPYRGIIELFGKPFGSMKSRHISLNIAMLTQQPSIYFAFSVFDTVMMGRYLYIKSRFSDSPTKEDKEAVFKALEVVDLLGEKDKDISKLSGGQLQRVFLARVLARDPKIVLLDEPTNHLDLKCQVEIIEYLKNWATQGERVVVGVLHDINLAMRLSDNLIVMKAGEIQAQGKADEIIGKGILDRVYEMDVAEHMRTSLDRWLGRV